MRRHDGILEVASTASPLPERAIAEQIAALRRAHLLAKALGLRMGAQETERQVRELLESLGKHLEH